MPIRCLLVLVRDVEHSCFAEIIADHLQADQHDGEGELTIVFAKQRGRHLESR